MERGGSLGRGEKERGRGFPLGPEQEERMARWAKLLLGLRKCEGGFRAFRPKQKKGRFPFFFSFVFFSLFFLILFFYSKNSCKTI